MGFLPSGWLEQTRPEAIPLLRIHAVENMTYHGEPYPYLVSTRLVPQPALSAAPHISNDLRLRVMEALLALRNPALTDAADITGFTLPDCYESARQVAVEVDILHQIHGETFCHHQFQPPSAVLMCPDHYVMESPEAVAGSCHRFSLHCPSGLDCVCHPCVPVKAINVFPWQIVLALCVVIFVAGLVLTLGWRAAIEISAEDTPSHRRRDGRVPIMRRRRSSTRFIAP